MIKNHSRAGAAAVAGGVCQGWGWQSRLHLRRIPLLFQTPRQPQPTKPAEQSARNAAPWHEAFRTHFQHQRQRPTTTLIPKPRDTTPGPSTAPDTSPCSNDEASSQPFR